MLRLQCPVRVVLVARSFLEGVHDAFLEARGVFDGVHGNVRIDCVRATARAALEVRAVAL